MARNRKQESLRRFELEVQRDALAVAAGIKPPLQWKTGLAIDEDDVRFRREKGRRDVYEHRNMHGAWLSMSIRKDEKHANELALAEAHRRREADRERLTGKVPIELVPLRQIAARYLELMDPGPNANKKQLALQRKRAVALERILGWMGKDALGGDAMLMKFREYEKWRTKQRARPGTVNLDLVKPSTAADDARWLSAALNRYNTEKNKGIYISVKNLPRAKPRDFYLDEETYVRLLVTLRRGWIWDAASNDWEKETVVDPQTGESKVRNVVHKTFVREGYRAVFRGRQAQRAVMTAFYTGARHGIVVDLGWKANPDFGWIDLKSKRVFQTGTRSKPQQRESGIVTWDNKKAHPVYMARQFRVLAAAWHKADQRIGATHVVQRFGAGGAGYVSLAPLLKLVQEAGMRIGVPKTKLCFHTLRHTIVTMLLLRNCPKEDTADFISDSIQMVDRWYSHLGLDKAYAGKHLGADKADIPVRTPLEALELRDRGPMLAKQARLAREAKLAEEARLAAEARRVEDACNRVDTDQDLVRLRNVA